MTILPPGLLRSRFRSRSMTLRSRFTVAALLVLAVLAGTTDLLAQTPGAGIGAQSMRPYRFVFLAYAVAWLLVLGWLVTVSRRLGRLQASLEAADPAHDLG